MTQFTVAVYRNPVEHKIRLGQVVKWAEHMPKEGPAGIVRRQRVRTLLGQRVRPMIGPKEDTRGDISCGHGLGGLQPQSRAHFHFHTLDHALLFVVEEPVLMRFEARLSLAPRRNRCVTARQASLYHRG